MGNDHNLPPPPSNDAQSDNAELSAIHSTEAKDCPSLQEHPPLPREEARNSKDSARKYIHNKDKVELVVGTGIQLFELPELLQTSLIGRFSDRRVSEAELQKSIMEN